MRPFKAKIEIIGVNPYVLLPATVLKELFKQAQKDKGPIPVCGTIDGHKFIQTLVKYSGKWRLYINGPMLKISSKKVGDTITLQVQFDPVERTIPVHPKLTAALKNNKEAKKNFDGLSPSRKKEIIRYISFLKTEASVEKNILRVILFLSGKARFVGRDKP
jgi:hypothetical protein